jgi:DNA polymerase III epsilon subunit-like protein
MKKKFNVDVEKSVMQEDEDKYGDPYLSFDITFVKHESTEKVTKIIEWLKSIEMILPSWQETYKIFTEVHPGGIYNTDTTQPTTQIYCKMENRLSGVNE